MVGKIVYNKKSADYLETLAYKLYKKNYFSFIEYAEKYVTYIVDTIEITIHEKKHNVTPYQYKKHGTFYVVIITNKRTAFHVYFDKKDSVYIIKKIENNHLPSAKFLNEL